MSEFRHVSHWELKMILEFSQAEAQIDNTVIDNTIINSIANDSTRNDESTHVELMAVEKSEQSVSTIGTHRNADEAVVQADGADNVVRGAVQRSDNAMLMLRMDDDLNRCWPLNHAKTFIIGREDDSDMVLADRQVSRRHAAIRWNGKAYELEDLGSTNGTHVNGNLASRPVPLADGDDFMIGFSFRVSFVDDGATAPLYTEPVRTGLSIDAGNRTVRIGNELLDPPLSPPQFHLLQILWDANSSIVSRDDIAETVWPEDSVDGISEQAIDALVRRLRERIAEIDPDKTYIATIRGHGFRLNNRSADS